MVKKLSREMSEHNPLILFSEVVQPLKFIEFRFELSWLENPDFYVKVDEIWNKPCRDKSTLDKTQQKLMLFKQYFKGWRFNL